MKLNLAKLQLLSAMLHIISNECNLFEYHIVYKVDNHIVTSNFFKEFNNNLPMIYKFPEYNLEKNLLINHKIRYYIDVFLKEFIEDNEKYRTLWNYPELLLENLYGYISNLEDFKPIQNYVFDINFLLTDTKLDFYCLDVSLEYELVSIKS